MLRSYVSDAFIVLAYLCSVTVEVVVERLIGVAGLVLLIVSLFLPWVSIELLGKLEFSLYDLLRQSFGGDSISAGEGGVSEATVYLFAVSIISLIGGLIAGLVSVVTYKAGVVAGAMSILSGIAWFAGISSLKSDIVASYPVVGGLVSSAVSVGAGPLVAIIGGILFIIEFGLGRYGSKKRGITVPEPVYPPPPPGG